MLDALAILKVRMAIETLAKTPSISSSRNINVEDKFQLKLKEENITIFNIIIIIYLAIII